MKKEALTGIHFLEKTSYYDQKKDHFPLLWIMIQLAAFGLSLIHICGAVPCQGDP